MAALYGVVESISSPVVRRLEVGPEAASGEAEICKPAAQATEGRSVRLVIAGAYVIILMSPYDKLRQSFELTRKLKVATARSLTVKSSSGNILTFRPVFEYLVALFVYFLVLIYPLEGSLNTSCERFGKFSQNVLCISSGKMGNSSVPKVKHIETIYALRTAPIRHLSLST